jgi:hypothetical protein
MKLPRRHFLHLAVCVAALPVASRIAKVQTFPSRPITMFFATALTSLKIPRNLKPV